MTSQKPIRENLLVALLAAAQFTHIVDFMIMMPMGDILQRELLITPFQFSALVSAYPMAAFLSSLFGVFFLDKFDRKKALVVAYSGFVLGTFSSAVVPTTADPELNYILFIGTRLLTGLAGGILSALVLSIIGDVIPLERRGRAMGYVTMAFSLAAVLGVPLALELVNRFDGNWHLPFYLVSAMGGVVVTLVVLLIPPIRIHLEKQITRPHPFETLRKARQLPNQRRALLFMVLLVLGQFTVIPFITPYMINNVGLTQAQIPLIYLVGGACTTLSSPFVGRMVDRFGRKPVFYTMALGSTVPLLLVTHVTTAPLALVLTISGVFFIFISGRMIPANTMLTTVVRPENRGGFMSLNASVMSLASGSAALISGSIVSQSAEGMPLVGFNTVGYIAVTFTLLALFLGYAMKESSGEAPSKQ
ncbi:MAG: MFS transporter [Flavobacteriales bacterium]